LQLNRIVCVSDEEALNEAIKRRLGEFGYLPQQVLSYSSLGTVNTRSGRGKSIILISPTAAINDSLAKGMVDGGLVRFLNSRIWRDALAFREADAPLSITAVHGVNELAQWVAHGINAAPKAWLDELLLTLLYRRHESLSGVLRRVANSVWAQVVRGDMALIEQSRAELLREGLVSERGGLACNEFGRQAVEECTPFADIEVARVREGIEPAPITGWEADDDSAQRDAHLVELVLDMVQGYGWVTVNEVATAAVRANVMPTRSLSKSRRFLEKLVARGTLREYVYRSGVGRPRLVFMGRNPTSMTEVFENTCGECVFYSRVTRRCRLWWALSRFDAPRVYAKEEGMSPVARDKLHNAIKRVGPTATSCEMFAPKRKDYPLAKARDKCVSCGLEIDSPAAKTVKCSRCLTAYKPLATKILVTYDYEQVFKERYLKLAGVPPPRQAIALPEQEFHGKTDWRDVIVLYPNEKVRLADDGMQVERGGHSTSEPYARIYQVVDYGALRAKEVSLLKDRGIPVVQRRFQEGPETRPSSLPLYPSPGFLEKLRWLEQNSPMRKKLLESAMLSAMVATKRIASRGGPQLKVLVNRQILEFMRMEGDGEMTLSRALAYEARVNGLYWSAYKTMLRVSGLDFQSRVRDRFVREIVQSVRARARGYSPANAAINYLHQRRLLLCRLANARAGIGWIGCEGVLHVAKREPSIGLMLDLSDSFRLADRENFLDASLRFEVSREDFVARPGKQRVWFYHPTQETIGKLDVLGSQSDQLRVNHRGADMTMTGAYDAFVESFVEAVQNADLNRFHPFVYGSDEDKRWLESKALAIHSLPC